MKLEVSTRGDHLAVKANYFLFRAFSVPFFARLVAIFILAPLPCFAKNSAETLVGNEEWTCEDHLSILRSMQGATRNCRLNGCNENVLKIYNLLSPKQRQQAKIVLISPLDGFLTFRPLSGRAWKEVRWHFHAVILYKGRIIDPDDGFMNRRLADYLPKIFPIQPQELGIWVLSHDDYLKSKSKFGWLYVFHIFLRPPNFLSSDIGGSQPDLSNRVILSTKNPFATIPKGTRIRVDYWITPTDNLEESELHCIEGALASVGQQSISIIGKNGPVEISYPAIDGFGPPKRVASRWTLYPGWWNYKPPIHHYCDP